MRKSFFIINPAAGKRLGEQLIPLIQELWAENHILHTIYVTQNHADIGRGVEKAKEELATELVVVGGDGTLLAVVNALGADPLPLGIVPCGTGNDFARTNEISLDARAALDKILKRETFARIDVGTSNGSYFLNVASIGLDAAIVRRTEQVRRWLKGPWVYLVASVMEIIRYRPTCLRLTVDGRQEVRNVVLVAVANGRCYGGGMQIAPMADPTDGFYDVILAHHMGRLRLIWLLPKLYRGSHIGHPDVEVLRCRSISIECDSLVPVNRDGEIQWDKSLHAAECSTKIDIIGI